MKIIYEHDKAILQYNEEIDAVELIWKKFQDAETYKLMFEKGLEFLKNNRVKGWLSDIRKEGVVGPASTKWLKEYVVPKTMEYGLKKVAMVMDSDVFKEFYFKNVEKDNVETRHFDSIEAAHAWLRE